MQRIPAQAHVGYLLHAGIPIENETKFYEKNIWNETKQMIKKGGIIKYENNIYKQNVRNQNSFKNMVKI